MILISAFLAFTVLVAILAELSARWCLARARYYVWPPSYQCDNELLPSAFTGMQGTSRFSINRDGERGDEPPAPEARAFRILVAGGSTTECYFLDQSDTWPAQLQSELNKSDWGRNAGVSGVYVSNIGRSGVDSTGVLTILEHIIPQHPRLDAVILMTGAGEIMAWLRQGADSQAELPKANNETLFTFSPGRKYSWWPLRSSALADCWRHWRPRFLRSIELRCNVGKSLTRLRRLRQNAKNIRKEVPSTAPLMSRYAKNLEAAIRSCQRRGIRVIVMPQPWLDVSLITSAEQSCLWNGSVGYAHSTDPTDYYDAGLMSQLMAEIYQQTAHTAESCGATVIPVQHLLQPMAECFYDDVHFTPFGAAIVGRSLAAEIAKALGQ